MRKKTDRKLFKQILAFIMAAAILAGDIGWSDLFSLVSRAAEAEPEFNMSIESVQGANTELVDEEKQYYMLRNMKETDFSLNLKPLYTQGISVHGAEITIQTPYFAIDGKGKVTIEYDDKTNNANALVMQLTELPSNWTIKGTATTSVYRDGQPVGPDDTTESWEGKTIDPQTYFAGTVILSYNGINGLGSTGVGFSGKAKFLGNIPENYGGAIRTGMKYDSYEDNVGQMHDSSFSIPVGGNPQKDENNYNEVTLIHSNLQWNQTVTNMTDSVVMWREYNYVVTKLTVENTSTQSTSAFEKFDINLNVTSSVSSGRDGVTDQDVMAWFYKDGQEPEKNTSIEMEDREKLFVGKPNEGGILIYDVTDVPDNKLSDLDTEEFANAGSVIGKGAIPYLYASDGNVHIKIDEKLDNKNSKKTFLIAVPYRASIMTAGSSIAHGIVSTVYYGHGENMYSWSKQNLTSVGIDPIVYTMNQNKYVKDENGNKLDETEAFVLQPSTYYIGDIGNYQPGQNGNVSGNVPAFNAYLVDTIPEGFELSDIKIHMLENGELTDWFREEDTFQYEVEDPATGEKSWKTCELKRENDQDGNPISVWSADWTSVDANNWTRRIRFIYKEEILPGDSLNGYIEVNGKISNLGRYTNTVATESEKHIYVYDIDTQSGKWQITPMTTKDSQAVLVGKPAGPDVDGRGVYYETETNPTIKDGAEVSLNDSAAAFRFYLENTSKSYMVPAVFHTESDLLEEVNSDGSSKNDPEYTGFFTESIVFSKQLLDTSQIQSIKMIGYKTTEINEETVQAELTIDKEKLEELLEQNKSDVAYDSEGNIVISADLWKNEIGELDDIEVEFNQFPGSVSFGDGKYVEFRGTTNRLGKHSMTGCLKAPKTDDLSEYVEECDEAWIETVRGLPVISATSNWNNINTGTLESKTEKLNVPYKAEDIWYDFELSNQGKGRLEKSNFNILLDSVTNKGDANNEKLRGFRTTKLILDKQWLEVTGDIELKLYKYSEINQDGTLKTGAQPYATYTKEQLEQAGSGKDKIEIEITEPYIKMVQLYLNNFKGYVCEADEVQDNDSGSSVQVLKPPVIHIVGSADWYDELIAKGSLESIQFGDEGSHAEPASTSFEVQRPYVGVHSHIQYMNQNETVLENKNNTDGDETAYGVPYDRDFSVSVELENGCLHKGGSAPNSDYSDDYLYPTEIEKAEIQMTIPVKNKQGTAYGDSSSPADEDEAYTGFHVTKIKLGKELFSQFDTIDAVYVYNVDDPDNPVSVDLSGGSGGSAQDLEYTEEQLKNLGITHLAELKIVGHGFDPSQKGKTNPAVTFYGFEDSVFGTEDYVKVNSKTWVDTDVEPEEKPTKEAEDSTLIYVSKMYFDTVTTAMYNDGENYMQGSSKVTEENISSEHMLCSTHASKYTQIDVPNKTMVSLGMDFRQYLNVGKNYPDENYIKCSSGHYSKQEHENRQYVNETSLNTAGRVTLTMEVPEELETYYLKLAPENRKYVESITVKRRQDEHLHPVDLDEIKTPNAAERGYYRINLLSDPISYGITEEDYYKEASLEFAENRIEKIIVTININQEQGAGGRANMPDYGTWYKAESPDTHYGIEVVGRVQGSGTIEPEVSAKLEVGSSRAKQRETEGEEVNVDSYFVNHGSIGETSRSAKKILSSWSYYNSVGLKTNGGGYRDLMADARDMKSTSKINITTPGTYVRMGVEGNPEKEYNDTAIFGQEYEFTGRVQFPANSGYMENVDYNITMPVLEPGTLSKYFGFQPTAVMLENELRSRSNELVLTLRSFHKVMDPSGGVVTWEEDNNTDTLRIEIPDEGQTPASWTLKIKYDAAETKYDPDTNTLKLKEYTTIKEMKCITSDWQCGVINYNLESKKVADSANSGSMDTKNELRISGNVYVFKNQKDGFLGDSVKHAQVRIEPIAYNGNLTGKKTAQNNAEKYWVSDSSVNPHSKYDTFETASIRSFQKEVRGKIWISKLESSVQYDYDEDNLTPNTLQYGVKVQNGSDKDQNSSDEEVRESGKASLVDEVTARITIESVANLYNIRIPAEFVEGQWFEISGLSLTGSGDPASVLTVDVSDIRNSPYWKKENDQYIFDVYGYLKDYENKRTTMEPAFVTTYDQWAYEQNEDTPTEFTRAYVKYFDIAFHAKKGWDIDHPENLLQADEFLAANRSEGYAFTYECVVVDSTSSEFDDPNQNPRWTMNSTPTFNKTKVGDDNVYIGNYKEDTCTSTIGSWNLVGGEPHSKPGFSDQSSENSDWAMYTIKTRVGTPVLEVKRTEDGLALAEDQDSKYPWNSYEIGGKHVLPGDRIQYDISLSAKNDSLLDLTMWEGLIQSDLEKIVSISTDDGNPVELRFYDDSGQQIQPGDLDRDLSRIRVKMSRAGENLLKKGEKVSFTVTTQVVKASGQQPGSYTDYPTEIIFYNEQVHAYPQVYPDFPNNTTDHDEMESWWGNNRYEWEPYDKGEGGKEKYLYAMVDRTYQYPYEMSSAVISADWSAYNRQGDETVVTVKNITNATHHVIDKTLDVDFLKKVSYTSGSGDSAVTEDYYLQTFEITEFLDESKPELGVNDGRLESYTIKYRVLKHEEGKEAYNNNKRTKAVIDQAEWKSKDELTEADLPYIIGVRIAYKNLVPKERTDQNLPNVGMKGILHYQDVRVGKITRDQAENWQGELSLTDTIRHTHDDNIVYEETDKDSISAWITSERAIVRYATQVFDSEEKAEASFNISSPQMTGYRPNQHFWYKTTVVNLEGTTNETPQGDLIDPVFYDKIPIDYLDPIGLDKNGIKISWTDSSGQNKFDPDKHQIIIKPLTKREERDYGGAMLYAAGSWGGSDAFDPTKLQNTRETTFQIYKVEIRAKDGSKLRVLPGETVSIWHEVAAREDGLPIVLQTNADGKTVPMYTGRPGYIDGPVGGTDLVEYYIWYNGPGRYKVATGGLLPMDFLIHDVGFSSDRNDQSDLYDMYDWSTVYIPGADVSLIHQGNYAYFSSAFSRVENISVTAREYAPKINDYRDVNILPTSIGIDSYKYYKGYLLPRTNNDLNWEEKKSGRTPILWTQTRVHLQKAWLYAASEIEPILSQAEEDHRREMGNDSSDAVKHYDTGTTPTIEEGDENSRLVSYRNSLKSTSTLEVGQQFYANMTAANYGDWGLDGVEFFYTLPAGTKPVQGEDGKVKDVSASVLSGVGSIDPYDYLPKYSWNKIESGITAEIVQDPSRGYQGYPAADSIQDPVRNGEAGTTESYYSEQVVPYVVKITVDHELAKWMGRNADEYGYQINVKLLCEAEYVPESGIWNDTLSVKPYMKGTSENHLYYTVYNDEVEDYVSYGSDAEHAQLSGMDYIQFFNKVYNTGSLPATKNINGYNVRNRSSLSAGGLDQQGSREINGDYYADADKDQNYVYAVTGTQALTRKPFLRNWATVSRDTNDVLGTSLAGYTISAESGQGYINAIIENRYWDDYENRQLENPLHTVAYPLEGGSMGSYIDPSIAVVLPYGVAPRTEEGEIYQEHWGKSKTEGTLKWEVQSKNSLNGTNLSQNESMKEAFTPTVRFEQVPVVDEDGTPVKDSSGKDMVQGRYIIYFEANDPSYRFYAGDLAVFSISMSAYDHPEQGSEDDASVQTEEYNKAQIYYSSGMPGFQYLSETNTDTSYEVQMSKQDTRSLRLDDHAVTLNGRKMYDNPEDYKETDRINVDHLAPKYRKCKELTETQKDFNQNGGNIHQNKATKVPDQEDVGLTSSVSLYSANPRLESEIYISGENKDYEYGDNVWVAGKVTNKPDGNSSEFDQLKQSGEILHSKLVFAYDLPGEITFYDTDAQIYRITWYDAEKDQTFTVEGTEKQIREKGYIFEVTHIDAYGTQQDPPGQPEYPTSDKGDSHSREKVVVEFATPAHEKFNGYESSQNGYHAAGYLSTGSWVQIELNGRIDSLTDDASELAGTTYDSERPNIYVGIHESDGGFNQGENIDQFAKQNDSDVYWANNPRDSEEGDPQDYDEDGVYTDAFTASSGDAIAILNPDFIVRGDMATPSTPILDPDNPGEYVANDPYISSVQISQYVVTQALNNGGAVNRLVLDYAIPYRGTVEATKDFAGKNDKDLLSVKIQSVSTGVWSIPEEYKENADKYKIYVFARNLTDQDLKDRVDYLFIGSDSDKEAYESANGWVQIGKTGGYGLTENATLTSEIPGNARQIRFVIKAGDSYEDEEGARAYPVPNGTRLNVDADPDTDGIQEINETDPKKNNFEQLPDSILDNAVILKTSTLLAEDHVTGVRHFNYFAWGSARYDDMKYLSEDLSRMGAYLSPETPKMYFGITSGYFSGTPTTGFKWELTNIPSIDYANSKMLRYSTFLESVSQQEMKELGLIGYTEDNLRNPAISIVLPFISSVKDNSLVYVPYEDMDTDYLGVNYEIEGSEEKPARENLDKKELHWTWHVEKLAKDENGDLIKDTSGNYVTEPVDRSEYENRIELKEGQPTYVDKVEDLVDGRKKKIVTYNFDGYLKPGERIVVDMMCPVEVQYGQNVSKDMLETKAYGFKDGNFSVYIPSGDGYGQDPSLVLDSRDINSNENTNEMAYYRILDGIGFLPVKTVQQVKTVDTQINQGYHADLGVAAVPEGTDYTFTLSTENQGVITDEERENYQEISLYDVLPYVGDSEIYNSPQRERSSQWRGYLDPDTIKVTYISTLGDDQINTPQTYGDDYEIWLGPIRKENGTYKALDISSLPAYSDTSNKEFYRQLYGNSAQKTANNLVSLSELLTWRKSVTDDEWQDLVQGVQLIYMEMTDPAFTLDSYSRLEMSYSMHAPVNAPMYVGNVVASNVTEQIQLLKDYSAWNTFVSSRKADSQENAKAGVYVQAPEGRGFIGSYVWLDADSDGTVNDGYYITTQEGRKILQQATVDIDGDGTPDDPGINGIKVELLSVNGRPVNRDGQSIQTITIDGAEKYLLIDDVTGLPVENDYGFNVYTEVGPAVTYITRDDYYGNRGNYMLSNLAPGEYKLRFTFPNSYQDYAVTTPLLGEQSLPVTVDRSGGLVVTTEKPVEVKAVNTESAEAFKEYNQSMTSYNLGVIASSKIGGEAWLDSNENGWRESSETKLPKAGETIKIKLQRYNNATGQMEDSYDIYGNLAETTLTPQQTHFEFEMMPGTYRVVTIQNKDYIASKTVVTNNPLENTDDNDLFAEKVGGTEIECTELFYLPSGKDYKDAIGLGYVRREPEAVYIGDRVWDDADYNGLQDLEELGMEGVTITLEKYYKDNNGDWQLQNDPYEEQVTDPVGRYRFTVPLEDGQNRETGVKLFIEKKNIPDGYGITLYQQGDDRQKDSDLSRTAEGDRYYLTKDVVSCKSISEQNPNESTESGADYSYDAGFKSIGKGSVTGYVWDDVNYNGIRETSETGWENIKVILEAYTKEDSGTVRQQAYDKEVETDAYGRFVFDDVNGFMESGNRNEILFYRLNLEKIPEGYGATKYQAGKDRTVDSDLLDDSYMSDYFVILGPASAGSTTGDYVLEEDGIKYDVLSTEEVSGYDAGLKDYAKGEISGTLWLDTNQNGLQDDVPGDDGTSVYLQGITVILDSWYYDGDKWISLNNEKQIGTDSYGNYSFKDLPATVEVGGKVYLAGYQVRIDRTTVPDTYVNTIAYAGKGISDSDLIREKDQDKIIPYGQNSAYIILCAKDGADYDWLAGVNEEGADGGYIATDKLSGDIWGYAWLDVDYDGYMNLSEQIDRPLEDRKFTLAQYYYDENDQEWKAEDAEYDTAFSYMDGSYLFQNVPSVIRKNGKLYLAGYRIEESGIPNDHFVTKYRVSGGTEAEDDNDLRADDHMLQAQGEFIILSKPISRPGTEYRVEVDGTAYDLLSRTERVHGGNGGEVSETIDGEERTGSLSGIIWREKSENSVLDKNDGRIKNVSVNLSVNIWKNGKWETYDAGKTVSALTDGNGRYIFDNLPGSVKIAGVRYLLGYDLKLNLEDEYTRKLAEKSGLVEYLSENGSGRDSKLQKDGFEFMSDNEMYHGKYIILDKSDGTNQTDPIDTGDEKFDFLALKNVSNIHGGFVEKTEDTEETPDITEPPQDKPHDKPDKPTSGSDGNQQLKTPNKDSGQDGFRRIQTGVVQNFGIYILLILGSLSVVVILLFINKRRNKKHDV